MVPMTKRPFHLRPREKILQEGSQNLSTAELLALILGSGRVGENVVSLADRLLVEAEGLRGLKNWTPEKLMEIKGIGPAKAARLLAFVSLVQRLQYEQRRQKLAIKTFQDVIPLVQERLRDRQREVFLVVFLDSAHHLIGIEELFEGGVNYATISPRIVVTRALDRRAVSVIVAHNHPSGAPEPSSEDCQLTKKLCQALKLVEIRLLGHLLIAADQVVPIRW